MQSIEFDRKTDAVTTRNYGIDLLRLVSMFMVVVLHVLGQGGVLAASEGAKNHIAWLLEVCAYCAVDCYALISGFVCYTDTHKHYQYKKFVKFWAQVFTYSFGITFIAFLIKPHSIGIEELIYSMVPIASKRYWYVSAYAGLFFIIPWINKLLRSCSKKEASCFVLITSTIFVLYVTFANIVGDCFLLDGGYSFLWLTILYIIGAWMKKCDIPAFFKSRTLLVGMIGCAVFTWIIKIVTPVYIIADLFVNYTSVTIVFIAFAFVSIFAKLKLCDGIKKLVICFSPAAFGVYLIHVQPRIWSHFMAGAFTWIVDAPCWLLPVEVLLSAFGVFVCCLFIEKVRLLIFCRLGIDKLIERISDVINSILSKLYGKAIERF